MAKALRGLFQRGPEMIKEALTEFALSSTRFNKAWKHDRMATVGGSEIGRCAREIYWRKKAGSKEIEDEKDEERWGARIRGTVMEKYFWNLAMKKKFGKKLLYSGDDQTTLVDKYLSATPDGLVVDQPRDCLAHLGVPDIGPGRCFVIECKTIDPRINLTKEKEENAFQTQVQLGLFRTKTKWRPEVAIISYMDASFWNEVMEFVVRFDQKVFDHAHKRATIIKTADRPEELKPEGWIAGGSDCEYCTFTKACGVVRRSVPDKENIQANPQLVAEITDLCREHEQIALRIEKDTAILNEKKQEIKDRLREKNLRRIPKVVVWSAVKGRQSYDYVKIKEAAVQAGVDVEQFSTVGEPTDRMQVLVSPEALPPIPERMVDHMSPKTNSRSRRSPRSP